MILILQTALCSTVLDNPNKLSKIDITEYFINYLTTDTLLFQSHVRFFLIYVRKYFM